MKKVLKCFIPLFLIVVLCASPITANASTWRLVDGWSDDYTIYKQFEYTPPLFIDVGQIGGLPNNENNGGFFVKAGQTIIATAWSSTYCYCTISIVNQVTGNYIASKNEFLFSNTVQIFTDVPEDGYYVPIIEPKKCPYPGISPSTNLMGYYVSIIK